MTENEWSAGTMSISNFEIDVAFLTTKEFFVGDENNYKQIVNKSNFVEPLYIPFGDANYLVTTNNVSESFGEMIKYYQNVLLLAKKHNKKPSRYYFWIRPIIRDLDSGKILISFPWYDTLNEIKHLFIGLMNANDGNIFYDTDQGWELVVDHFKGQVFVKESDPESNEIHCKIRLDRTEMVRQIVCVLDKTVNTVSELTNYFSADYWTKRV